MTLIPDQLITADGLGKPLAVQLGASYMLKLSVLESAAQQSLDVQLEVTADGLDWQVIAAFPQRLEVGHATLPLDLPTDARYLRAHWRAKHWSSGETAPRFRVSLTAQIRS